MRLYTQNEGRQSLLPVDHGDQPTPGRLKVWVVFCVCCVSWMTEVGLFYGLSSLYSKVETEHDGGNQIFGAVFHWVAQPISNPVPTMTPLRV